MPVINPDPGKLSFRKGTDWMPLNHFYKDAVYPTASDDNTLGFSMGSRWMAYTSSTNYREFICEDDATGAAIWVVIGVTMYYGAPGTSDDYNAGFRLNSLWSDANGGRIWQCTDDTVGAAVWGSH